MTLSASVEVMEARRHEMSERGQAALDLLTEVPPLPAVQELVQRLTEEVRHLVLDGFLVPQEPVPPAA